MTATSNEARANEPAGGDEPAEAGYDTPDSAAASAAARSSRGRASWWNRLGIQSKLLAMLLGVSVLSSLVAGLIGYRSGTESLRDAVFERVTEVRQSRIREVTNVFTSVATATAINTRGATIEGAIRDFSAGMTELADATVPAAQDAALDAFYQSVLVPRVSEAVGTETSQASVEPRDSAQRYLQAFYTAATPEPDDAIAVDDAGDGSAWSAAHASYHDTFREITTRNQYEDLMLLDTEGTVIYSAYKRADLGSNILTGPYSGSGFQEAYDEAMRSNSLDFAAFSDFEFYQPAFGAPTAFAVSPVADAGQVIGALAVELPVDRIEAAMSGNESWEADGLGETGEAYLVGPDHTMRSDSRMLRQDPERFAESVRNAGTPAETVDHMMRQGTTVLLQPIESAAADRALRGQTGTLVAPDYLNQEALIAYAPLGLQGLPWGIVVKIESAEAFRPVSDFARNLALSIAGIILAVSLASLLLAQVFVRPVRRLLDGVRKVAGGDLTATVEPTSRDEFGDLAVAFNDMSQSLRTKAELIDEQQAENERLLLTMMPEPVARRYRGGDETIAEDHSNVTVVFAEIAGFDAFSAGLPSHEALALLNEIVRGFDDAAEQLGIENVRTLREGYLASCGLVVPRVDHVRRTVDFAREMHNVVSRFNSRHGTRLALRAGVNTGTVTSGLVGQASLKYDLWGDAVNLAYRIEGVAGEPGVFVTSDVYDRLRDTGYDFAEAAPVQSGEGEVPVWRLVLEDAG